MNLSTDELELIKSCLLTAREFLNSLPMKNKKFIEKINAIDNLLLRFKDVS